MKPFDQNPNPYDLIDSPAWKSINSVEVEFIFRNGTKETVTIDTSGKSRDAVLEIREEVLRKVRLAQIMFEHGTHGQITVQGVTVRADDLVAIRAR